MTMVAIALVHLIVFIECNHNAALSRVSWDGGPGIEVATPIWPPCTAGAKQITSSPSHVLFISLECGVFVS